MKINNDKISLQELVGEIAEKSLCSKREVELYIREFINSIDKGLTKDGVVKIKGLGTLKLTWNEARKSVNVSTGEAYEIPAHNKLVLSPESYIKEAINTPYADMQTINATTEASEDEAKQIRKLHNQAEEIKGLLEGLGLNPLKNDEVGVGNEGLDIKSEEGKDDEQKVERQNSVEKAEEGIARPIENYDLGERVIPVKKKKKSSKILDWTLLVILIICLGGVLYYIEIRTRCFSSFFETEVVSVKDYIGERWNEMMASDEKEDGKEKPTEEIVDKKSEETTANVKAEQEATDNAIVAEVKAEMQQKAAETQKAKSTVSLSQQNSESKPATVSSVRTVYNDIITEVTLEKGGRLTILSQEYYGDKAYWVYIYDANRNVIANPDAVRPGMKLKIPRLGSDKVDLNNPATIEKAKQLAKQYLGR